MFGERRRKVLHKDTMHYVSLVETLKMLLENRAFLSKMRFSIENISGSYFDFCDGSFFQNNAVFKENPTNCLQIIAYYDEIELCNPLGTSVKKHKLGCIFYTIGNLHPKHRSTFKTIFLSTIVNHTLVERHGINAVLQPFVIELNQLSTSGIEVNGCTYKGTLVAFLADNLASHTIGGFKQSMSFARHICRSCMTTKEDACKNFFEEDFVLRTPQQHEAMCLEVINDTSSAGEKSIEYGINERSVLNDVVGFSVIGGLCHDVMHDLLEGVLPYELRLLLQHMFNAKYITLAQYNDRVTSFDYGYTELSSKPNELSPRCFLEQLKLRYSASEMLLLARVLPFIIGDKVPEDDEHYNCFLQLLKVLQIVLSPTISDDVIAYLRVLIDDHHSMFVTLYPNESFIPKLHYLIH